MNSILKFNMNDKLVKDNFGRKHTQRQLYYLNDYGSSNPRFRIESGGGPKVVWRERTYLANMEHTKKYIESVWTHK